MIINVSRICPERVKEMKTIRMRMKMKVKTIENQRVSDLSEKRHRNENIPNAYENENKKLMKINMSRICPKSVTGMKTFQMRMKMKVKVNENQRFSDLSRKGQRNENNPNAYENESKND